VIESSLGPWADQWDRLVEQSPLPSPFLRSWWLEEVACGRPRFLLVTEGRALIGGLAVEDNPSVTGSRVRMMGSGPLCPDHLDLLAVPGREYDVARELGRWLTGSGSRFLDLQGLAASPRLAAILPETVHRSVIDVAPWTRLPSDPDVYLSGRSDNFRANLRKVSRRMSALGAVHHVVEPSSIGPALTTLRDLHAAQWGSSPFLSSFDRFARAAIRGAERSEIVVHELVAGGEVAASLASFEVCGRLSLYQGGRNPDRQWRSATTLLIHSAIQDACRRGFNELDLLRGNEPYKRSFAEEDRVILRLRAAHGAGAKAAMMSSLLLDRVRLVAKSILARPHPG
jgi:CelD/BcsL family acetyltransferase involved in cellulose biosynthesis